MAVKTEKPPSTASPLGAAAPVKGAWGRLGRRIAGLIPGKLWATPAARRWWVAGILYAAMLAILLAGSSPVLPELVEGQVATVDVMAPRDAVDRFRTEQLREEAARQAIRDAAQDPANYEINPAVALQREEWLGGLFRALAVYRGQLAATRAAADGEDVPPAAPMEAGAAGEGPAPGAVPEEAGESQAAADPGTGAGAADAESPTAVGQSPIPDGGSPAADTDGLTAGEGPAAEGGAPVADGGAVAADHEALPAVTVTEADVDAALAYVQREVQATPSRELVAAALRASESDFETMQALAVRMTADLLSRRRIAEGDVAAVRAELWAEAAAQGVPPHLQEAVAEAVSLAVVPNLILSPERVERARQEAMRQVKDVVIREGQVIVRRGDPILAEHVRLVQELGLTQASTTYGRWFGTAAIVLALFVFIGVYARQFLPEVLEQPRLLFLLGLIAVLVTGLARIASLVPWDGALYLIPVALAGMLIALLIDSRLAFALTVALAVVVATIAGGEIGPVIVALAGGIAGVFSVSKISQRSDLTRAGFIVAGVASFVMVGLFLTRFIPWGWEYGVLGLVNGLVSAVATIGLLPYLEGAFGITSTIRLLELSNPNQPLLRKLLMEAPGTYHHSIIVGNLSEAAADAIGADSLLVRVGALYHDIGKTRRPYFFVENQFGGENPHDKISPSLSTLIIVSHVKDGVEMAREHRLPEPLIAFIREHHGTALVRYFYQKAVENAKGEPVDPKDFSYPGPRPQSRETAIVMLADSVEAAVRSLSRPAPGRIEGLVRKIIKEKLAEGELDESDLTLKDLDRIADAFVRVLTGIFHKRVEYPEFPSPVEDEARGGVPAK